MFGYYFYIQLILQAICVLHVIRTTKDRTWLYVIVFLPYVGPIAYFIAIILPSLRTGNMMNHVNETVGNTLFPSRKISAMEEQLAVSDTYKNRIMLAEAYASNARYDEAIDMFSKCLTGLYKNDPVVLGKRALTYYASGNFELSKQDFETILINKGKLPEIEQLIFAIVLEHLGNDNLAESEYQKAVGIATGAEAEYRYAMFLKKKGNEEKAIDILENLVRKAKASPAYFRRKESKWIGLAKNELQKVPA